MIGDPPFSGPGDSTSEKPTLGGGGAQISVPEPPTGIGRGFLSEYWRSTEPLPRNGNIEGFFYYLHRGLQTVTALPMSSLISVLTISVSLLLLAGFLLLLQNVGNMLTTAGDTLFMTAYLKSGIVEKQVVEFIAELESNSRVRSVTYVSNADALQLFRKDLGERAGFLHGLEDNNPLPASVDIVLRPGDTGLSDLEQITERLRAQNVVEELVYGSEWVRHMQGVLGVFRVFGVVSLVVAMLVIMFLISNTIKLVIYARRDEVSIMQLVGASDNFIRFPFVVGGLLQGVVGSIFGLVLLKLCFLALNSQIESAVVFGITLPDLLFLDTWSIAAVVLLGGMIGAAGSYFALGRFMNV